MPRFIVFLLGIIVGIILSIVIDYKSDTFPSLFKNSQPTDSISDTTTEVLEYKPSKNIQYLTIAGRNGEVTVNTDMKKDSIRILVGKPTRTEFYNLGSIVVETWEYDFKGQGPYGTTRTLEIKFHNGKLDSINDR